jgi:hypothetical protein
MLPNGILLSLDMAIAGEADSVVIDRQQYALCLLGLFREDVVVWPNIGRLFPQITFPSLSIGHLWPWSKLRFVMLYNRAVLMAQQGKTQQSHYMLGRALHVLIDMACPVHAHPVWHYLRDPYERYVDFHATELAQLPLPVINLDPRRDTSLKMVTGMARASKQELADATQSPLGRLLKYFGLRKPLRHEIVAAQAQRLIPLVAAHIKVLLEKYQYDTGSETQVATDENSNERTKQAQKNNAVINRHNLSRTGSKYGGEYNY